MMQSAASPTAFQTDVEILPGTDFTGATLQFPSASKIRVQHTKPNRWVQALMEKFEALLALNDGWDGYVGRSVSLQVARFAWDILERLYQKEVPPPSLVPGSDGSLQIEWHLNGYDIELDIIAPLEVCAYRFIHRSQEEEEILIESDFTDIARWIDEIRQDDVKA